MALEPTRDPLGRALEAARAESPEGWVELSESVMSRVRALVAPSDPVLTFTADATTARDAEGSRTFVSARVITAVLRRMLQGAPTHAPDRIKLDLADDRIVGVELSLVCAYGVDLIELADRLRDDVLVRLRELLGPDPDLDHGSIHVEVTDIVDGDPNLD